MFTVPFYQYKINNWKDKKIELLQLANQQEYYLDNSSNVFTTYGKSNSLYVTNIFNLIKNEFSLFNQQANLNSSFISDLWFQKYYENQYHAVHNHGAIGYSSVLYIEFDKNEHKGTQFISPFTNAKGFTEIYNAEVEEGDLIIFPSVINHCSIPTQSKKLRMILSMNIKQISPF